MGKALPLPHKFQPDSLGARAPQSFRSGIVAPDGHRLLGGHAEQPAANGRYHPLRDGAAAVQEDAFWHDTYIHAPYYVTGRGYDQYRPAYAMGWQAAFDFKASEFAQIEQELERRWEAHDTSSLLEWVQVRDAVHGAWLRARQRQGRNMAVRANDRQDGALLRPLYRLQLHTAHDLTLLLGRADPPPTAFVRQVVDRHLAMLQEFSGELAPAARSVRDWADPLLRIGTSLHYGGTWLRSWVQEVNTERVLQLCAEREQQMLALYPVLLATVALSPEPSSLLQRQQHRLQLHHAKLQWVRQHWMERG